VDAIVDLVPETSGHCARRLHARHGVGDPRRHQVTEWPAIAAHITEYRRHRRQCPACGTTTLAALPDAFAGHFGPQLTALIAYLTVVCWLPRLVVQRLLAGALQIPISVGSTQKAWEEASAAVAAPHEELQHALAQQPVLNGDETGHRTNGAKRWLSTLVAPTFVFYTIASSRGVDVLRRLLGGAFPGVLASDRLRTYLTYRAARRQLCWAHFTRNLLSAQELAKTPAAKRVLSRGLGPAAATLSSVASLSRGSARPRGSTDTRPADHQSAADREAVLLAGGPARERGGCRGREPGARVVRPYAHFFTFVYEEEVDPTNNVAERALRTAVQWRKIMFGNRSDQGELAVARLLTMHTHVSAAATQRTRVPLRLAATVAVKRFPHCSRSRLPS
jgi:transposase